MGIQVSACSHSCQCQKQAPVLSTANSQQSVTKYANFKLNHKSFADFWECSIAIRSTAKVTCVFYWTALARKPEEHVSLFLFQICFLRGKQLESKVVAFDIKCTVLPTFPLSHQLLVSMAFSHRIKTFMRANLIFSLLSGDLWGNFYQCHFTLHMYHFFLHFCSRFFRQTIPDSDKSYVWCRLQLNRNFSVGFNILFYKWKRLIVQLLTSFIITRRELLFLIFLSKSLRI